MSRYVIIDGQLQKSSPELSRWAKRAGQGVPSNTEEEPKDVLALPKDRRSDWEILEGLEEQND
jgi:hypothetical protein